MATRSTAAAPVVTSSRVAVATPKATASSTATPKAVVVTVTTSKDRSVAPKVAVTPITSTKGEPLLRQTVAQAGRSNNPPAQTPQRTSKVAAATRTLAFSPRESVVPTRTKVVVVPKGRTTADIPRTQKTLPLTAAPKADSRTVPKGGAVLTKETWGKALQAGYSPPDASLRRTSPAVKVDPGLPRGTTLVQVPPVYVDPGLPRGTVSTQLYGESGTGYSAVYPITELDEAQDEALIDPDTDMLPEIPEPKQTSWVPVLVVGGIAVVAAFLWL
jgi:hypothetical protein